MSQNGKNESIDRIKKDHNARERKDDGLLNLSSRSGRKDSMSQNEKE
jgi:hypothetical protein